MGAFFTNLHVRTGDDDGVIVALRRANALPACVSPTKNGWVSAFPAVTEEQDHDVLVRVTVAVAKHTRKPAIAFLVHDSDVFQYVFCHGRRVDAYDSAPSYFDEVPVEMAPIGGNVKLLMKYCVAETRQVALSRLLRKSDGDVDAEDVLNGLAEALGIDGDRANNGYAYLKRKPPVGFRHVTR